MGKVISMDMVTLRYIEADSEQLRRTILFGAIEAGLAGYIATAEEALENLVNIGAKESRLGAIRRNINEAKNLESDLICRNNAIQTAFDQLNQLLFKTANDLIEEGYGSIVPAMITEALMLVLKSQPRET